jgi:large subunit ribosomal protein L4
MLKIVEYKLPKEIFEAEVNLDLLAHANHVYVSRDHVGLRNTKTRSEINRTTKKVYKQKGTGGARHGSRRANLFVGGGVVFGPRPEKRILNLSQSIKNAARIAALSAKNKNKEVFVVGGAGTVTKTKEVSEFLKKQTGKKYTFLVSEENVKVNRFIKNLENARTFNYKDATAYDILRGGVLLIDELVFDKKVTKVEKTSSAAVGKTPGNTAKVNKQLSNAKKAVKKGKTS